MRARAFSQSRDSPYFPSILFPSIDQQRLQRRFEYRETKGRGACSSALRPGPIESEVGQPKAPMPRHQAVGPNLFIGAPCDRLGDIHESVPLITKTCNLSEN